MMRNQTVAHHLPGLSYGRFTTFHCHTSDTKCLLARTNICGPNVYRKPKASQLDIWCVMRDGVKRPVMVRTHHRLLEIGQPQNVLDIAVAS